MKKCGKCLQEKDLSLFSFRHKTKKQYQSWCKSCRKTYDRARYDTAEEKVRLRDKSLEQRLDRQGKALEYLSNHPCVDCGETDPVVLEFDHLRDKTIEVSTMIRSAHSWANILAEIQKCEIRCANCHRRRTATQFNFYRQRGRV